MLTVVKYTVSITKYIHTVRPTSSTGLSLRTETLSHEQQSLILLAHQPLGTTILLSVSLNLYLLHSPPQPAPLPRVSSQISGFTYPRCALGFTLSLLL